MRLENLGKVEIYAKYSFGTLSIFIVVSPSQRSDHDKLPLEVTTTCLPPLIGMSSWQAPAIPRVVSSHFPMACGQHSEVLSYTLATISWPAQTTERPVGTFSTTAFHVIGENPERLRIKKKNIIIVFLWLRAHRYLGKI